jgi:tetratricopeptide (TPR) repeat protein
VALRVANILKVAVAIVALGTLVQCVETSVERSEREPATNRYGSYLAGRYAASERDASSAALYYEKALKFDPGNLELLERAIMSEVAEGDLDGAVAHAEELIAKAPNARIPRIVIAVRAMREGAYARARGEFEKVAGNAAAEIAARLGLAYAHFSEGDAAKALATIEKLTETGGARAFALYHLGVIEDLSGHADKALKHFEEANRLSEGDSLRILLAYAAHLARNGQIEKAKTIYAAFLKKAPSHPIVKSALARIAAGGVPDRVIASAKAGLAETFYGIASSLSDERAFEIPVFYLQLSLALEPKHDLALSLLGDRYEAAERWDDAIAAYGRVASDSPVYRNARLQIAQSYQKQKKPSEARNVLEDALTGTKEDIDIYAAIGDVDRSEERYTEAAEAYSKAIALIDAPQERHWTIYYTRGIAFERSKRWSEAERDLQQALKLKPEQPLVMNYLAYTWVEQGVKLKEALAMLARAVELRPEDGFIIDSLGWAYYRMGDYRTAIKYLEQAIQLEPSEATVNDHLGDAYWRVGRRLEAKYQWQHALTLKPEKSEEPKIRQKIEAGLPELPGVPAQAGQPQAGQ